MMVNYDLASLPETWNAKKISEISERVSVGFVGVTSPYFSSSANGIPIIRSQNIRNGKINVQNLAYVTREFHLKNKKSHLKNGDIVIVRVGENRGDTCIIRDEFDEVNCANVVFFRPIREYAKFFELYLRSPLGQHSLVSLTTGSAQGVINTKAIAELVVPVPPLNEALKISDLLESLDDKIDLLQRQNKTLEQLAETLFRQWFVEEAEESWEVDILDNLFDIGIGRTPPRKESQWFSTDKQDVKWVSIKDMGTSGIYIDTTSECLTQEAVERFSVPVIPENTVLLSFKMTIGRLAITTEKMLSNEAIAHFKQKENSNLFPEFLYLYLKTYRWEQLGSTSSIVEAINSQMIKEMELAVPDEIKLIQFKEQIKPHFQKIKSNQKQIRTLTQLRDTLLPKLMSGEVRVK